MPLMAHKDNGFHQASSGEVETLKAAGWELCADPIEYKRRVWGIDYRKPEERAIDPVAESQAPEPSEPGDGGVAPPLDNDAPAKRRGRPRKEQ